MRMLDINGTKVQVRGSLLKIARLDGEKFLFASDPQSIIEGLRKASMRVDLFTFIQSASETTKKYSFPVAWDNLATIKLTTFDEWWSKRLGFKARNKAKQAEKKGVVIREVPFSEELARGVREIYNESPVRQGRKFPHFGKSFETVYREEATYLDKSIFIGAYSGEKLIGFIKMIICDGGDQAGLLNIVSLLSERDKAPTNALVAAAVRACASRGISYLTYSNFSYGQKQRDSLSDFKERNGFERVDIPRYYVPLTSLGRVAFRIGLHRKISERIPESLAGRLRDIRNAWYKRRFSNFRETS
jgi:hypothetical protein